MSTTLPFRLEAGCDADTDLLQAVFEKCPQGIAIIENGQISRSNDAFARLFGYTSPRALKGRPLGDLLPISHRCAALPGTLGDAFAGCGYPGCQFQGRRNDGSHSRME